MVLMVHYNSKHNSKKLVEKIQAFIVERNLFIIKIMPVKFNIFRKEIPMYGLLCIIGIILSITIAFLLTKKKKIDIFDFTLSIVITLIGAWIGAKLLFLIISWNTVVSFFEQLPIFTALEAIITGGYVFYGGLLGGAIALFITLKIQKKNIFEYVSIYVTVLPLGHAFGRIGCFISGCCYGIEYNGIFSYTYTQAMDIDTPLNTPLLPIQLIESIILFVLFLILLIIYLKYEKNYLTIIIYCLSYPIIRFILEFFRGDKERGIFLLSTSQWISLILLFTTITLIILTKQKALHKSKLK